LCGKLSDHGKLYFLARVLYEFEFSLLEDMRRVLGVGSWQFSPGFLRLLA